MRNITVLMVMFLAFAKAYPQPNFEKDINDGSLTPETLVKEFFTSFHKKDTASLRTMFIKDAHFLSIVVSNGEQKTTKSGLQDLLISLSSILDTTKFQEELQSIDYECMDYMCTVTAPYTFKLNDTISHSGNNLFTLFKINEVWKIATIADSRIYE
jgi:hypothetical protein